MSAYHLFGFGQTKDPASGNAPKKNGGFLDSQCCEHPIAREIVEMAVVL